MEVVDHREVLRCLITLVYMSGTTVQGVSSVNCFVYLYKCFKLAGWTVIKIGIQIAATGLRILFRHISHSELMNELEDESAAGYFPQSDHSLSDDPLSDD